MTQEKMNEVVLYYPLASLAQQAEQLTALLATTRQATEGEASLAPQLLLDAANAVVVNQLMSVVTPQLATILQGYLTPTCSIEASHDGCAPALAIPLSLPLTIAPHSVAIVDGYIEQLLVNQLVAEWLLLKLPAEATPFLQRAIYYTDRVQAVLNRRATPVRRPYNTL